MFLPIEAAPEYEINEYGLVRRVDTCRPLTPFKRGKYDAVKLNGVNYSIHRLVLMTFHPIENYDNMDVDHIDYNPDNNHLSNLRWLDHRENARRQRRRKDHVQQHVSEEPIHRHRQRKTKQISQEASAETSQTVRQEAE